MSKSLYLSRLNVTDKHSDLAVMIQPPLLCFERRPCGFQANRLGTRRFELSSSDTRHIRHGKSEVFLLTANKCSSSPSNQDLLPAEWSFDGSSTGQAEGRFSDCILQPVKVFPDPIRGGDDVLIICEVYNPDGSPHETNTRSQLREIITDKVKEEDPLYGFEQEYTM